MVKEVITRGRIYVSRQQSSNGGFVGEARPDERCMSRTLRRHPTVFFTALILNCLHDVPGTQAVRRSAAEFLMRHKSDDWSWNYWTRDAAGMRMRPYPDDLDDTACALAALCKEDAGLIGGTALASVARQLIATEVAPGGPYRTWLVGGDAPEVWRDVDVAVNANIGYFLSSQNVQVPGLERFLGESIVKRRLTSPYYCGEVPVLYFLARWYQGSEVERLTELVRQRAQRIGAALDSLTAVTAALLLAAGMDLHVGSEELAGLAKFLTQDQRSDGSWSAGALYYEPPVDGVLHYAGSAALTTAFCLEALVKWEEYRTGSVSVGRRLEPNAGQSGPAVRQLVHQTRSMPDDGLRRRFRKLVRGMAAGDRDGQITNMAGVIAQACGRPVQARVLQKLNAGSLAGWVAYTVYDDFLDGEGQPELLGAANLAKRLALQNFQSALAGDELFAELVSVAFQRMDSANTWEVTQARATVHKGKLWLSAMPDYDDYRQLADRSWGHTLAACGSLMAAGHLKEDSLLQLQRFFHHFLIARQLNDDAHDWEEDLRAGRLTATVALLLHGSANPGQINLQTDMEELRQRFWQHAITEVTALIGQHTSQARLALRSCLLLTQPAVLESWLDRLEDSARRAERGRDDAKQFIAAYRAKEAAV